MRVPSQNHPKSGHLLLSFVLLSLFLSLAVSAGHAGEVPILLAQQRDHSPQDESLAEKNGSGFIFEEHSVDGGISPPALPLPEPDDCLEPTDREPLPKIAIIIDDMGHHRKTGGELLELDLNLTFSFLPHAPFTAEQEKLAWENGRDILVHMPMEPRDASWDPGEGALYTGRPAEEIKFMVRENLKQVPHASGVNNHMGSRFTADRQAMRTVLTVLKEEGLFFVDSLTGSESVGADEARKMGMKTGSRIVFLDNVQTQEDICRQLKRLVAYARKHGSGIGIGHPNRATLTALRRCRDMLVRQVSVVGVHELVQ